MRAACVILLFDKQRAKYIIDMVKCPSRQGINRYNEKVSMREIPQNM